MTLLYTKAVVCSLVAASIFGTPSALGAEHPPGKAGYGESVGLEGPGGVISELAQDDIDVGAVFRPHLLDGALQPWFDLKRKWNQKYGLQLGFNYNALYMAASESLSSDDDAGGGRFQAQGMWTMLGRGTQNSGGISFRFEDRHRLGTDIPPSQLGSQFGSATNPGTGFSDFGAALTELAWRQTLLDGKMKFGIGKISATSFYNAYALSSALTGFQNSAMRTSGTKAGPGRGLGAIAAFRLGEDYALLAGIHDANAVTADNPFDTIDQGEFFYSAEFRWFPTSWDRRKWDQVRMQVWYQDELDDAGRPSGYGATFAASRLFDDFYMPWVVAGWSDGDATTFETDVAAGIAFAFNTVHRAARDVLGVGVSWGRPSSAALQEQYGVECFYRLQLLKHVALTPSVQYIVNPAAYPGDADVWLAGIRARMTF